MGNDMRTFTSTDLANKTGDVFAAASQSAVEIHRHGKPRFVLMSTETYERLTNRNPQRALHVDDMSVEELDAEIAVLRAEIGEVPGDD